MLSFGYLDKSYSIVARIFLFLGYKRSMWIFCWYLQGKFVFMFFLNFSRTLCRIFVKKYRVIVGESFAIQNLL